MSYATKNYSTGDTTVIGGKLVIEKGAAVIKYGKKIELVDKSYVDDQIKKLRKELNLGG